ncbi:MAG: phage head closure protein [Clostridium celatum]|jgi:SPP1 family predicted phage head-tail adaptor|uniref:phage head closure protein n=1 Tax=Clostridium saudiense TaxID=1414720 RepID=UPI0004AF9772|nr:phage head closure protein [Clostridium saudiense]MDU4979399.1 phage head closure protein [Clostridium celatum]SCJ83429.1 Bacteriophage head-tail adaptor [uncultured Clostridium sp.]
MSRYRINPGELRHRITIQKLNNSQNEYGEVSELWEDILNVRAGIYPISGKEFFAAETVNSEISHKVKIRYIEGIMPNMRIKFNNRIFSIESVINFQERNIELQLLCKELI